MSGHPDPGAAAQGKRHVKETLYRPGSAEAPLSDAQLAEKFESLAAHAVAAGARERIRARVSALETLPAIEPLVADLRA